MLTRSVSALFTLDGGTACYRFRRKHQNSLSEVNTRHKWPAPTEGRFYSLIRPIVVPVTPALAREQDRPYTLGLCLGGTRESPH